MTVRFLFSGESDGVDVFELVETRRGPTFKFQYRISWSKMLPEYDQSQDPEAYLDPEMMQCYEDLLVVAHANGLVTVWDWRVCNLKYRIDYYYRLDR